MLAHILSFIKFYLLFCLYWKDKFIREGLYDHRNYWIVLYVE